MRKSKYKEDRKIIVRALNFSYSYDMQKILSFLPQNPGKCVEVICPTQTGLPHVCGQCGPRVQSIPK